VYGQGLFSSKSIIVLDRVFGNEEGKEVILARLKDIAASENVFVLFEGGLDKKTLTKLEKHAEKSQGFDTKETKTERFNVFSLTDALGKRDRRALWVKYQQAKLSGVSDEEIHGVLFWQIKTMLLAAMSGSASEANLNPFVYKKSRGFLKNYTRPELSAFSASLVRLYHDARRGKHELGVALERFILSLASLH